MWSKVKVWLIVVVTVALLGLVVWAGLRAPGPVLASMPGLVLAGYLIAGHNAARAKRDRERWYRAYGQALEEIKRLRSRGNNGGGP